MCGIVGVLNLDREMPPVEASVLRQMLAMIRHRGPDGFGVYRDAYVGLGSARLSIVDLAGGDQPISNEDETLWVVFNGEIFNYPELRPELEARGHHFKTKCDTEVLVHLYEDLGPGFLQRLNGQFAIAIWDTRAKTLFLARDRLGVRPLFYTEFKGRFVFGSEIKTILSLPDFPVALDRTALDQVFRYWSVQGRRTIFNGVRSLLPGHYLIASDSQIQVTPYWDLDFSSAARDEEPIHELETQAEDLLQDAVRLRLWADVPVGVYLSGGLDSSLIAALASRVAPDRLESFSISFDDPRYDESPYQQQMAAALGTRHHSLYCTDADIGRVFPDVIWHAETPVLRTAPAPMFLLSQLVHENGMKVVLTGEGADEFLGGYDIFKEAAIRRFWARQPDSQLRPLLLRKLYPDITDLSTTSSAYLAAFFRNGLTDTASPFYSHAIRWGTSARLRRFLAPVEPALAEPDGELTLPPAFEAWHPLARAQYLEVTTFLSPYLLATQGDRVAMAHSVEGRFPFLDYRIVAFCNRLPASVKLRGLTEKWLLKRLARRWVPEVIWKRVKRPYRAPIQRSFLSAPLDYVDELLSDAALRRSGLFNVTAVEQLVRKTRSGARMTEFEEMAFVGILSAQVLEHRFVHAFRRQPTSPAPVERIIDRIAPLAV